jgi:hypothetical protein
VTWSKIHTEDPSIFGVTVQNLDSWVTRRPGLCTPWHNCSCVPDTRHTAGNHPISNHDTTAFFQVISNSLSTYILQLRHSTVRTTTVSLRIQGWRNPGARSAGRLTFFWQRPICMGPQYGISFVSTIGRLKFWYAFMIFGKIGPSL